MRALVDSRSRYRSVTARERVLLVLLAADLAPEVLEACTAPLQRAGYVVGVAIDADMAAALASFRPQLLVIAGALGTVDQVVDELEISRTMVILIGLSDPSERVRALQAGYGDVTPVPVDPGELVARATLAISRTVASVDPTGHLRAGNVTLDEPGRRVSIYGEWIDLTLLETRLLTFLLRHPGIPHRRETLLEEVWGYSVGDVTTVTVHIRRLRQKVEADAAAPRFIKTVWGVGYRCDPTAV